MTQFVKLVVFTDVSELVTRFFIFNFFQTKRESVLSARKRSSHLAAQVLGMDMEVGLMDFYVLFDDIITWC